MTANNPRFLVLALALGLMGCRGALYDTLPRGPVQSDSPRLRVVGPTLHLTNPYQVYVNYVVPPERLRARIPPAFELITRPAGPAGEHRAFLTITWFGQRDIRTRRGGLAHPGYNELNVRTPVRERSTGRIVLWMFPALAEAPFGTLISAMSGLCTADVPVQLSSCRGTRSGPRRYGLNAGRTGEREPRALVERLAGPRRAPPGFTSLDDASAVLLDPAYAAYALPGPNRVGWMWIDQSGLDPGRARLVHLRMPSLARSGLLPFDEQASAHSVFVTGHVTARLRLLRAAN